MFRGFWLDLRGNFILVTCIAMVPIMGALAIAVDYGELTREKEAVLQALDAAGIATARRFVEGATDEQLKAYANDFFEANLSHVSPVNTTLTVELPNSDTGGGTLNLTAELTYGPVFLPTAAMLLNRSTPFDRTSGSQSEVRLKNTLEVALVLDNSGSMDYIGTGSGKKRIVLLKEAAKQLVDTIAGQAAQVKQVTSRSSSRWFRLPPRSTSAPACRARPGWTRMAYRRSITRISTGRPSPRAPGSSARSAGSTTRRAPAGAPSRTRR